jgi:uncharacterized protein YciI
MMEIRKERQDLHFEYLKKHESEILIAGGCREVPGGDFVGGLWVLEVSSKERAVELIENSFRVAALTSCLYGARHLQRSLSSCDAPQLQQADHYLSHPG